MSHERTALPDRHEAPTLVPGDVLPCDTKTCPPTAPSEPAPRCTALGPGYRFGDYEIVGEIARGGMGVVYRARQVSLDRPVAIKMILAGQLAGADDVLRFRSEAAAAAALQHPGIVAIHEVGQHDGLHYFSMDLVEGQSLADLVRGKPLVPEQAATYALRIAEAMAYAHAHGILHRDLKPSNVLVDPSGQTRITDFGLAKRLDTDTRLTATGQVVGTPGYMPPEQAAGRGQAIGPSSDLYSIGAILYELLTGRPPFQAASHLETLLLVLDAEAAPPRLLNPAVPRDLETVCLKCLEKDPTRRYGSAGEVAAELRRFLAGDPIQATTVNLLDRVTRALARRQSEEHYYGWSAALIAFAAIIFLSHVAIYALERAGFGPVVAYWVPRSAMFAAMFAMLAYARQPSVLPQNAGERVIWAVWIAYLLATGAGNLAIRASGQDELAIYGISTLLAGMGFFVMGAQVWGGCYLIGLAFMTAAPLFQYAGKLSSLGYGAAWGAALAFLAARYWVLARQARMPQAAAPSQS